MKNTLRMFTISLIAVSLSACASKSDEQAVVQNNKESRKNIAKQSNDGKVLATVFLQGIQEGNKEKMYGAANLTTDMVNSSREKLVYASKNKLTEAQRKECEHALRMSGQIDFMVSKLRKLLPQSSSFKITNVIEKGSAGANKNYEHHVTITYTSRDDAMRDTTNRAVKELIVHLQQFDHSVESRLIHEFSFTSQDFDKMANRDFEVISYF